MKDNDNRMYLCKNQEIPIHKTIITYSNDYNESVTGLHDSIEKIYFGDSFNQLLENLPNNLSILRFGYKFNQTVDNLQRIDNVQNSKESFQSKGIKVIIFGNNFNQSVKNLPNSIEAIKFGSNFNQSTEYLPESLKYLEFVKTPDIADLPISVETVNLGHSDNLMNVVNKLHDNIKKLYLQFDPDIKKEYQFKRLPKNIEILEIIISSSVIHGHFIFNVKKRLIKKRFDCFIRVPDEIIIKYNYKIGYDSTDNLLEIINQSVKSFVSNIFKYDQRYTEIVNENVHYEDYLRPGLKKLSFIDNSYGDKVNFYNMICERIYDSKEDTCCKRNRYCYHGLSNKKYDNEYNEYPYYDDC